MYSSQIPYITPKYAIEVPTNLYYCTPCVYKIIVGSKYYIGKCKSLPQTMTQVASVVERAIRTRDNDSAGWYYHMISYIIRNRVVRAKVERLHEEMKDNNVELLKLEQQWLTKCKDDPACLNNNFDAYIPKWVTATELETFNKWKQDEADKRNKTKNRTTDTRKKHKRG